MVQDFLEEGFAHPAHFHNHQDALKQNQDNDSPFGGVAFFVVQHFQEELSILLNQIQLELNVFKAIFDLKFKSHALYSSLVISCVHLIHSKEDFGLTS